MINDSIIWVDGWYFLAVFCAVTFPLHIWATRGMGPADAFVSGFGSCVVGVLILAMFTWVFAAITGYSIGIK